MLCSSVHIPASIDPESWLLSSSLDPHRTQVQLTTGSQRVVQAVHTSNCMPQNLPKLHQRICRDQLPPVGHASKAVARQHLSIVIAEHYYYVAHACAACSCSVQC